MKKRSIQAINVGAAGHASDMIGRLRMNNSAIGKRANFKKAKTELVFASAQTGISLEKATPEQLNVIREQVMENRRRGRKKLIWSLAIAVPMGMLLIWGLWRLAIYVMSQPFY